MDDELQWHRGRDAEEQVLSDPFWSVVRRRHPDLTVAVLPPAEPPPHVPEGTPEGDVDALAAQAEADVATLWSRCSEEPATTRSARWTAGPAAGTVRRESSWVLEGADLISLAALVDRAAEPLRADQWRLLLPADGLPRATASRGKGLDREELLLLTVPASGRAVLRHRSRSVLVGVAEARRLVGEQP